MRELTPEASTLFGAIGFGALGLSQNLSDPSPVVVIAMLIFGMMATKGSWGVAEKVIRRAESRQEIERIGHELADRLGETELERLSRKIEALPAPLDDTVQIGELLAPDDREWLADQLKLATSKDFA